MDMFVLVNKMKKRLATWVSLFFSWISVEINLMTSVTKSNQKTKE